MATAPTVWISFFLPSSKASPSIWKTGHIASMNNCDMVSALNQSEEMPSARMLLQSMSSLSDADRER